MGKFPYIIESEDTENTSSSIEYVKKKKKFSILKYSNGNAKKKKCKLHSKSGLEDSDCRSDQSLKYKLHGILKHRNRESSDEDEDSEPIRPWSQNRCLVGRVPRPAGAKPGRGGGVAIIVKRNVSGRVQPQASTSSTKRRWTSKKRLAKKRLY